MNDRRVISDEIWAVMEPLLPSTADRRGGRYRDHSRVVEGIAYKFRTGCPWRDVHRAFAPWQALWKRHDAWSADGPADHPRIQRPVSPSQRKPIGNSMNIGPPQVPVATSEPFDDGGVKSITGGRPGGTLLACLPRLPVAVGASCVTSSTQDLFGDLPAAGWQLAQ